MAKKRDDREIRTVIDASGDAKLLLTEKQKNILATAMGVCWPLTRIHGEHQTDAKMAFCGLFRLASDLVGIATDARQESAVERYEAELLRVLQQSDEEDNEIVPLEQAAGETA